MNRIKQGTERGTEPQTERATELRTERGTKRVTEHGTERRTRVERIGEWSGKRNRRTARGTERGTTRRRERGTEGDVGEDSKFFNIHYDPHPIYFHLPLYDYPRLIISCQNFFRYKHLIPL